MKNKLKFLQSMVAVAMCVILGMSFTSCSDDDDETPTANELSQIVVGVWAQDGDNDILQVNANGTGVGYENPTAYQNNQVGYSFNWTYVDGWVNVTAGGELVEHMRASSVAQDKIVWQRYAIASDDYDPSVDEWDGHDAFGYYDFWTWERYAR